MRLYYLAYIIALSFPLFFFACPVCKQKTDNLFFGGQKEHLTLNKLVEKHINQDIVTARKKKMNHTQRVSRRTKAKK